MAEMNYRRLGKTGFMVSEISLGTWQVGGKWGTGFDHKNADLILNEAVDAGINFIDTADVYEMGESERAVGRLVNSRSEKIYVASKCGRQINPHVDEGYTPGALRTYVEESLKRMNLDHIDLIQLHCPPNEVYYRPEIFELFERLQEEGKIGNLGVSVEKVEQALKAIEYENVSTVQIIFNMFRQRPSELFFREAQRKDVGIIARVPLASGLLSGTYHSETKFGDEDHRSFNRDGAAFDKGETFSGIDYETGLKAVEQLKLAAEGIPLAQLALKWILQFEAVSCVIPGVSKVEQLHANLATNEMEKIDEDFAAAVSKVYRTSIKRAVHHLW